MMYMSNSIIINRFVLVTLLICTCIYVTVTDLKKGIIQNKIILFAGIAGLAANIVYYAVLQELLQWLIC